MHRFALALAFTACGGSSVRGGDPFVTTIDSAASGAGDSSAEDDGDADAGSADASDGGGGSTGADDSAEASSADAGDGSSSEGVAPQLDPPEGGSSGGSGGGPSAGQARQTPGGVAYHVVAPAGTGPFPLMIVYSGVEGGEQMTANVFNLSAYNGTESFVFAVLDGVDYNANGQAGADVLDHVRSQYDIDNDRTYLMSESAGTTAGLELGLQLRQSYFAAYWANDVNAAAAPLLDSAALGFQPFGNAGPGGHWAEADYIVSSMAAAGYRTPAPAPYDGPGSNDHGASEQFLAALEWFPGKTRQ
jgi:hypothetical protein